jgi:hypothetical protein
MKTISKKQIINQLIKIIKFNSEKLIGAEYKFPEYKLIEMDSNGNITSVPEDNIKLVIEFEPPKERVLKTRKKMTIHERKTRQLIELYKFKCHRLGAIIRFSFPNSCKDLNKLTDKWQYYFHVYQRLLKELEENK